MSRRVFVCCLLIACSAPTARPALDAAAPSPPVVLSIVGTSDWHGRVRGIDGKGGMALFAGYLANLRAVHPVVLLDAGDMFQGTLESNLGEGAVVVEAMNALGYTAAAVGNHEFDFGPVGPASSGGDPRGALAARAAEARFPFLAANVVLAASGEPLPLANLVPTALVTVGGIRVGLVGVTSEGSLHTTLAANVTDLKLLPLADTLITRARELRGQGAQLVVGVAHAGGKCQRFDDPADLSSCEADQELMKVAAALPAGTIDVLVGGHSHQAMAHMVNGVAIVQSYANGKAFGRVDVSFVGGKLSDRRIFAPQELVAGSYEGRAVVADAHIVALAADDEARASEQRQRPLGVSFADPITPGYDQESELGNLFADTMLAWAEASRPAGAGRYVALTNGGGLRAPLPEGPLVYGSLYEAYPFDNRFAVLPVSGAELAEIVAGNLGRRGGVISLAGVRVSASCTPELRVELRGKDGKLVRADARLWLVTSDFLATGGDGTLARLAPRKRIEPGEPLVRDAIGEVLARRGGRLAGAQLFDPAKPRLALPGTRPICAR